ncbi:MULTISPECIES: flagellar hook assembly protein FlgD [Aminobacter]|uniref:Basal-body rod modification protein FlgD n=1 Tax=Aminobacter carboxidus TaxID=376165 RepID=A0A8E1WH99_9HYPH|nr:MULTISPECIES: flagellar hook assembly protein FlgD [Aminobacter]MBB6467262.1 flagellar basal-body rod modification protein FlgD [Aminobacter lissarensis]MDR7221990.1 flagellar basal-body rod modification protein FlgD [Aminobacter aminovorans]
MAIDFTAPVNANTNANASKSTGSKTQVDYQSFLKLLMAQMKNQDPTKPMESTEYVAQLATFSQVEQSVQMNARLDQILQSSALAQADALIGRNITSADGKTSGTVTEVRLAKDGVTAVLADGKTVAVVAGVKVKAAA